MFTIDDYKEAVSYFASRKQNFSIKNEGDDCARVIFTNIFLNASKEIRIAANTLRNNVVDSPEYQDALTSFLSREGATLHIIIHNLPDNVGEKTNTNVYRRLFLHPAYKEGRVVIKNAGTDRFFIEKKPVNFCVADGIMYRLENDIVKRTAICNFGNSDKAVPMEKVFDEVFNSLDANVDLNQYFA